MRKINTLVIFILIFTLLVFPLAALPKESESREKPVAAVVSTPKVTESNSSKETENEEKQDTTQTVRVYDPATEKTTTLDMYEYIYGVVCAECPMLYHEEAIKSQIIAAYTYTLYCKNTMKDAEYDLTTQPETSQAYITQEKAFENWGSNAEKYDKKLRKLMDEVWGVYLSYKDEPILSAYHAISSGKTETAEAVWGKAIPYLVSADSEGDKLAEKYETTAEFKLSEAEKTLETLGVTSKELKSAKTKSTDCGSVLELKCGDTTVTGEQIRAAFNLRSSNFKIKVTSKKLTFTVYGYGHGLGMSQNGANFMAKAGCTYKEILNHYYKDVKLVEP